MNSEGALEVVNLLMADMDPVEQAEFRVGLQARLGLASGRVAVEAMLAGDFVVEQSNWLQDGGASDKVLGAIGPENWALAQQARTALAEKFEEPSDLFNAVLSQNGSSNELAMMYTGLSGLYRGSWNEVFARGKAKDYNVQLRDQKVDTRKAMTWSRYQAFIQATILRETTPLPDSSSLELWTDTWLTGEKTGAEYARLGFVIDGQPYAYWHWRDNANSEHRVRPAVVIAKLDI
jgi:hypothetical protein